jgi:hypothetical protein
MKISSLPKPKHQGSSNPHFHIRTLTSKTAIIDGQHRVQAIRGLMVAIESKNQRMAKSLLVVEPSLSQVKT